ncbi:unnamed protein product [Camellia sinensis]
MSIHFKDPVIRTTYTQLKYAHNIVRCSIICPERFSRSVPHWGFDNCDDDMCQIDDEDDLVIEASAKFDSVLFSDDFSMVGGAICADYFGDEFGLPLPLPLPRPRPQVDAKKMNDKKENCDGGTESASVAPAVAAVRIGKKELGVTLAFDGLHPFETLIYH